MVLLDNAYKSVSNHTIINCFRKAFFEFDSNELNLTTSIEVASDTFWDEMSDMCDLAYESFEDYVECDENLKVNISKFIFISIILYNILFYIVKQRIDR